MPRPEDRRAAETTAISGERKAINGERKAINGEKSPASRRTFYLHVPQKKPRLNENNSVFSKVRQQSHGAVISPVSQHTYGSGRRISFASRPAARDDRDASHFMLPCAGIDDLIRSLGPLRLAFRSPPARLPVACQVPKQGLEA
jgi:hypothetical protein